MIRKITSKANERICGIFRGTKRKLKDADVDKHVNAAAETVAATASRVQKIGSDALDAVTRQSVDKQVREYILLQNHYNDVLAMKLDEALKRIEGLERKVNK